MLISISTSRLLLLPPTVYVLGLVIKRIWVRGKRWRGRGEELRLKLPLPPGPPLAGNWCVGSLSVFRTEYVWQTFAEWSKSLGMGLVMLCKVISITPPPQLLGMF